MEIPRHAQRLILQFDQNAKLVATYQSLKEANGSLNLPPRNSAISNCCRMNWITRGPKLRRSRGFVWMFQPKYPHSQ